MFKNFLTVALFFIPFFAFGQTETDFRHHVEALTALNGREAGSEDCDKAADYLKKILKDYGLSVEYQAYTYRNHKSQNVIASVGTSDSIIVVGAHYDGQGKRHPSADDNASGCAVLLEMAKNFKKVPTWNTVVFILFSGEEEGLIGSGFYAKYPLFPKNKPDIKTHRYMFNLDMVGHLSNPKLTGPTNLPEILNELYLKYPFARDITLRSKEPDNDGYSFVKQGIPTVFIHTGLHNRYHKPTDTANSLNYKGMIQIEAYVEELIRMVAALPEPLPTKQFETFEYKP